MCIRDRAYIVDLLIITTTSFEDHLDSLSKVLSRLKTYRLKVNIKKSFFAKPELEYLGYWITREGIQPIPKKIQAILRIAEPKTRKQLRSFIGMMNFYRDMWIRRSHILAPLSKLTSKDVKWQWTEKEQKAFSMAKKVMSVSYTHLTLPTIA